MIEEKHITVFGADVSVFSDGSVHIHRGNRNKRHFGHTTEKGYKAVIMRDQGKGRTVFVHRLVGMAFIPNPDNKPQINHKNGDKTDNRPENLEWCTNTENRRHRSDVLGHYGKRTAVKCVEKDKVYKSISEAAKDVGGNRANIYECIKGKRKTANGYHWERV